MRPYRKILQLSIKTKLDVSISHDKPHKAERVSEVESGTWMFRVKRNSSDELHYKFVSCCLIVI